MIQIDELCFAFSGESQQLFHKIKLHFGQLHYGLIGPNGCGKSTFLNLLAGSLLPSSGHVFRAQDQSLALFNQVEHNKIQLVADYFVPNSNILLAAQRVLAGQGQDSDFASLDNEAWDLAVSLEQALASWGIQGLPWDTEVSRLSGGQIQRLRLCAFFFERADIYLMDEPTHHLDKAGRQQLFQAIESRPDTMIIASHDGELLDRLEAILDLGESPPRLYGCSYSGYLLERKKTAEARIKSFETLVRAEKKAKQESRITMDKQAKRSGQAQRQRHKLGLPKIVINYRTAKAELTGARLHKQHSEKIERIHHEKLEAKSKLRPDQNLIFDKGDDKAAARFHLVSFRHDNLSFDCGKKSVYPSPLFFDLYRGERLAIKGANGSGKTTFLSLIEGSIEPSQGSIERRFRRSVWLDQKLSFLPQNQSFLEVLKESFPESISIARTMAARYGLLARDVERKFIELSGGQRMKAALCLLALTEPSPDLWLLDEPTHHLDVDALEALVDTLAGLRAALIVVSHDERFLKELALDDELILDKK